MKNRKSKKVKELLMTVKDKKKEDKSFYLSLPVPKESIIRALIEKSEDTLIIDSYFTTIQEIGKLEASTLEKVAKIKYNFFWNILVIVAILVCLITGLFMGVKIRGAYDKFSLQATPTTQK